MLIDIDKSKSLESSEATSHFVSTFRSKDVSSIVQKYISNGSDITELIIDLMETGFKVSTSKPPNSTALNATIVLERCIICFAIELKLNIQHSLGKVTSVMGDLIYYYS